MRSCRFSVALFVNVRHRTLPGNTPGASGVELAGRGERQVHDAGGHHGRLARPRPRDEHERLQRPRDRPPLLVGGLTTTHDGDDLGG